MGQLAEVILIFLLLASSSLMAVQCYRSSAHSAEEMAQVLSDAGLYLEDLADRLSFLAGYIASNRTLLRSRLSSRKLAEAERIISAVEYQLEILEAARDSDEQSFSTHFQAAQADQYLFRRKKGDPAPWEIKLEGHIQSLGRDLKILLQSGTLETPIGPGGQIPLELCLTLAEIAA